MTSLARFLRSSSSRPESVEKTAGADHSFDSGLEAFQRLSSTEQLAKQAEMDDTLHETEDDARKRRLGEFLRRRQPSGLDTGSATPHPPRDNT